MIKDHEFLDLAVKNAQRNLADFIERSCERHLNEHRVQFLPKIEQITIDMHEYQGYLDRLHRNMAAAQAASAQYNTGICQSYGMHQPLGNIFGVTQ